jgi:hypothetical protein
LPSIVAANIVASGTASTGLAMRIYLNDHDYPNSGDRGLVRLGQRRIARALTAARADERRRGFDTPMPMRNGSEVIDCGLARRFDNVRRLGQLWLSFTKAGAC